MHYGLTMTAPPSAEPVTLAEAKAHLRVEDADEEGLIQALVAGARQYVEERTGRQLAAATFQLTLDWMPGYTAPGMSGYPYGDFYAADRGWDERRTIRLPRSPLVPGSVAVQYVDTTGATQTLSGALYTVDASSPVARLAPAYGQIWPVTRAQQNAVTVSFQAGWPHTSLAASIAAGTQAVTPASMAGIVAGSVLTIDAGAAQERVAVASVTATTFTATFRLAHDGTQQPVTVSAVPPTFRQAVLLLVGHWYIRREPVVTGTIAAEVPLTVEALLAGGWTGEYGP